MKITSRTGLSFFICTGLITACATVDSPSLLAQDITPSLRVQDAASSLSARQTLVTDPITPTDRVVSSESVTQKVESFSLFNFETRPIPRHKSGEPMPFFKDVDDWRAVDKTINAARSEGKLALVVMGANWCHDSRALAAHFEKERFLTLLGSHYKMVYVDVGKKDRNLSIAQNFGQDKIEGTPTVFVVSPDTGVLNEETAPTWRNAASRTEDDIYTYFDDYAREHKTGLGEASGL